MDNFVIENPVAEIYKNGELIETFPLGGYEYFKSFTVGTPETGINEIRVKNDSIWITHSDCPNQACVKTGYISSEKSFPLICLPNRLEIRIVGVEKSEFDAIAW